MIRIPDSEFKQRVLKTQELMKDKYESIMKVLF